jgi:hypothetical protein
MATHRGRRGCSEPSVKMKWRQIDEGWYITHIGHGAPQPISRATRRYWRFGLIFPAGFRGAQRASCRANAPSPTRLPLDDPTCGGCHLARLRSHRCRPPFGASRVRPVTLAAGPRASLLFHRAKKVRVASSQHEHQRERSQVVDFLALRRMPRDGRSLPGRLPRSSPPGTPRAPSVRCRGRPGLARCGPEERCGAPDRTAAPPPHCRGPRLRDRRHRRIRARSRTKRSVVPPS